MNFVVDLQSILPLLVTYGPEVEPIVGKFDNFRRTRSRSASVCQTGIYKRKRHKPGIGDRC